MREACKFNFRIHNGNILMSSVTKDPGVSSILLFSGSGINLYGSESGSFYHPVLRIRDVYPGSRIPNPDFYPSQIPDPKTATKERGENYFNFEVLKKKIWANF
jgi:hypothetical protein